MIPGDVGVDQETAPRKRRGDAIPLCEQVKWVFMQMVVLPGLLVRVQPGGAQVIAGQPRVAARSASTSDTPDLVHLSRAPNWDTSVYVDLDSPSHTRHRGGRRDARVQLVDAATAHRCADEAKRVHGARPGAAETPERKQHLHRDELALHVRLMCLSDYLDG